jgi:PHD/YefM family antitoxin component YafN of YafNO toxin-antitoxin module
MTEDLNKPHVHLPDWAFTSIATHDIEALIARTEHEIIIMTRRGRPDLVLISHDEWMRLDPNRQRRHDRAAQYAKGAPERSDQES